jgi:hypothetical protein
MAIVNFEQRAAKAKKVQVKKHTMIKNKLYKCVRLIVAAHANLTADEQQPLLHTCLQASNTLPIRLVALVIRRFKDQLALAKAQGNLPLHIAAASWPLDQDFLPHILREYPVGAQVPNKEGKLPLDVAETAGRGWNTGMRSCCALIRWHWKRARFHTRSFQYFLESCCKLARFRLPMGFCDAIPT